MARLQESFTTTPASDRVDRVDTGHGLVDPLTDREFEVLQLVATGSTNADVAEQLVVTLDTVKKHVSHILDKLGATNRTEAVARARKLGLIPSTRPPHSASHVRAPRRHEDSTRVSAFG